MSVWLGLISIKYVLGEMNGLVFCIIETIQFLNMMVFCFSAEKLENTERQKRTWKISHVPPEIITI